MESFTMTRDMVEEHKMRMLHIRKYYPFFKIIETSFAQYKEGKYANLDMGYITLAVLRFFMEENQFRNREVTYEEYADFMGEVLKRDFRLELESEEEAELSAFIFDKIQNDGKPFLLPFYDPVTYKKMVMRIKLLNSCIREQTVYYSITAEAIEFYLDTKEFKEQSTITIEQLLLEKMIQSKNFRGGTEVVRRINNEVLRLIAKKNEVLGILSFDVFEGMKAYEEFMENGTRWFEEEQKLFEKNQALIRFALDKAKQDQQRGEYNSQYSKAIEEIFALEQELKQAIVRHGELLSSCMDLQKKADELVTRSKLHALRSSFDFRKSLQRIMEQDRADKLEHLVEPILKPQIRKSFSLRMLDEMLTYRPEKEEAPEVVAHKPEEEYIYADEVEEQRIAHNFQIIMKILLDKLEHEESFTLLGWKNEEKDKELELWQQGDFYTFLIHLCQKKDYNMEEVYRNPDTFLEQEVCAFLGKEENEKYRAVHMRLEMLPDETVPCGPDGVDVTNVRFVRV